MSRNATVHNQPGAGRTIGLAITAAGSALESRINRTCARLGLGPDAAMQRIKAKLDRFDDIEFKRAFLVGETFRNEGRFFNDCRLLVTYST